MQLSFIKILLTSAIIVICFDNVNGQNWETGIMVGGSNYMGDMAPYPVPEETNFAGGLFLKRNLSSFFALEFSLNYGKISGNDANYTHLETRNLHFRNQIKEFSTQFEYNFHPFTIGKNIRSGTTFVFTGISVFHYEPQAMFNNEWVDLRPLRTEGQGLEDGPSKYSNISVAIPFGLGYKYTTGPDWNIGFKVGLRASFTDYLDDISGNYYDQLVLYEELGEKSALMSNPSEGDNALGQMGKQRGNPQVTDWYVFARVVISYRIKNPVCFKF